LCSDKTTNENYHIKNTNICWVKYDYYYFFKSNAEPLGNEEKSTGEAGLKHRPWIGTKECG
jgi:hypothetical protein